MPVLQHTCQLPAPGPDIAHSIDRLTVAGKKNVGGVASASVSGGGERLLGLAALLDSRK